MKKKLTQTQVLAKELAKRSFTSKQASALLGITRLAEIKRRVDEAVASFGYMPLIFTNYPSVNTRYGITRIAEYYVPAHLKKEYKLFLKLFFI